MTIGEKIQVSEDSHRAEKNLPEMPMKITWREDLERLMAKGCANPECGVVHDQMYMASACHPGKGVEALYDRTSGTISVTCYQCGAFIARVVVPYGEPKGGDS